MGQAHAYVILIEDAGFELIATKQNEFGEYMYRFKRDSQRTRWIYDSELVDFIHHEQF